MPVKPGLEHFQGLGTHYFPGQPVPKKFLPHSQPKSTLFQFETIPPCRVTTGPYKMFVLQASFINQKAAVWSAPWLLYSRLNNPNSHSFYFTGHVFQPARLFFCVPPLDLMGVTMCYSPQRLLWFFLLSSFKSNRLQVCLDSLYRDALLFNLLS